MYIVSDCTNERIPDSRAAKGGWELMELLALSLGEISVPWARFDFARGRTLNALLCFIDLIERPRNGFLAFRGTREVGLL